jgi:FixJ family two-component response regulator
MLFPSQPLPAVSVNMSQLSRNLFIRQCVNNPYADDVRDDIQHGLPGMAIHRKGARIVAICLSAAAVGRKAHRDTTVERSEKIYLVDDDPAILDALGLFLAREGYDVMQFSEGGELLDAVNEENRIVVILDHYLGDMTGLELQAELYVRGIEWPVIFISGSGDIALSVKAMKTGAMDFLEKPVDNEDLLISVKTAFARMDELNEINRLKEIAQERCSSLSKREREVMKYIASGLTNSQVAEQLGLSVRTVEVHRSNINRKMNARTLAELVRLADHCACCQPGN